MQPANWYKWFTKSASSSQKPEPESQNPQNPEPSTPENESKKPESSGGSASDSATTDSSDDEGWTEVGHKYSFKYISITHACACAHATHKINDLKSPDP